MNTIVPASLDHLLKLLADTSQDTVLLAGGTDFNIQQRKGMLHAQRVLYIGGFDELKGVRRLGDTLRLGALLTFTSLAANDLLRRHCPALCAALGDFASPPVRSLATLGGNIGNASPTADSVPLLLVRRASLELRSARGTRVIPLDDYYTGYKRVVLAPDELITAVLLPMDCEAGLQAYWRKVGTRKALIIAKLSVAALGAVEDGRLAECRIAAGALNEYPRRLAHVEQAVTAAALHEIARESISAALRDDITPIDDLRSDAEYRFETALNLIMRWLRELTSE